MSVKEKQSVKQKSLEDIAEIRTLILFNDDFNTFDFVIETLVDVCEHDQLQAENCAWIVHYKGKCPVKRGPLEDIQPRYQEMTNRTLTVEIK